MESSSQNVNRWHLFFYQLLKDMKLWFFFVIFLMLFRFFFICYFGFKLVATPTWLDLVTVISAGLRNDTMVSTYWVLIPFIVTLLNTRIYVDSLSNQLRNWIGQIFIIATTTLSVITVGFFNEFDDQLTALFFNVFHEDTVAILRTIWVGYHPLFNLFLIIIISIISISAMKRFLRNGLISLDIISRHSPSGFYKILALLLIFLSILFGLRGTFGVHPLRYNDNFVSQDPFLNKSVFNPYSSLLFALQERSRITSPAGLEVYLPDKDVKRAAQELFKKDEISNNLDFYLKKSAKGLHTRPVRHIFLIIMESYDTWPLMKKYDSLGLSVNLKRLAEQGIFVDKFLPAADLTLNSFSAIMTSLPFTDEPFNYLDTSKIPYPSSIAVAFKRLGYRTRFFHGGDLYSGNLAGYRVWGDFVRDQGFEEQYGGAQNILEQYHEWGVDDEYLFDYAANRVDDHTPSFNVIYTTSYHAPYQVDVWGKGFPVRTVPDDLKSVFDDRFTSLQTLGHLWYADRCLGNFVNQVQGKLRNSLFVVTGDHKSRRFIHSRPEYFEESLVPLVFYGKDVLQGLSLPQGMTGSHIDIAPTLIELVAPKGFQYSAMGKDMFDPGQSRLSIGFWRIIGPDFIADVRESPKFYPLPGKMLPASLPKADELRTRLNRYYGVSWWRVHYGPLI